MPLVPSFPRDLAALRAMRALCLRIITVSALSLPVAAALFALWPGLDLWFSGLFAGSGSRPFPMRDNALWRDWRTLFIASTSGTVMVCLLLLARRTWQRLRGRGADGLRGPGFAVAAYLLGPGLLINLGLKENWGRARPLQIAEFGGANSFTPALFPADQCARNCSFASGEGSALAAMALIAALLLWPRLEPGGRRIVCVAAMAYVAGGSLLRIGFGGHFLSDVVFAALLMGVVVPAVYLLLAPPRDILPVERAAVTG